MLKMCFTLFNKFFQSLYQVCCHAAHTIYFVEMLDEFIFSCLSKDQKTTDVKLADHGSQRKSPLLLSTYLEILHPSSLHYPFNFRLKKPSQIT